MHSSPVFTEVSSNPAQSFFRITSNEVKGKNPWGVIIKIKVDCKWKNAASTVTPQINGAFVC